MTNGNDYDPRGYEKRLEAKREAIREEKRERFAEQQAAEREREAQERERIKARWTQVAPGLDEALLERLREQDRKDAYANQLRPVLESLVNQGLYTKSEANRILDSAESMLNSGASVYDMPFYDIIEKNIPKEGMRAAEYQLEQQRRLPFEAEQEIARRGVTRLEEMMRSGATPEAVRAAKNRVKTELIQYYKKNPEARRGWADDWNKAGATLFELSSLELREYWQVEAFPSEKGAKAQQWFQEKFPSIAGDRGGARPGESWRDIITGSGKYAPKIRTIGF